MVKPNLREKNASKENNVKGRQRLRLHRFGMALSTYAMVTLSTVLVTQLGLGEMDKLQWMIFIGLGLLGNAIFFILFYTNTNLRFSDPSLTKEQIIYSAFWGMVALYSLPEARPIVLMFYVPAFSFGMLRLTRQQYFGVVAIVIGLYISVLALEFFQDRHGFKIQYELFLFAIFSILLIWIAFFGGFVSNLRRRLREQNTKIQKAHDEIKKEIEERKQAQLEKDTLIDELKDALNKVKTLSGLLPICASCKKIRDDLGYWNQIETYIRERSEATFSHGICPDCARELYPEIYMEEDTKSDI
jgi:Na+/melibiose symporter-like transporter